MQSATLTRPKAGPTWLEPLREIPERTWTRGAFGVLCLLALVGFFVYPTYPIYDSYYSLIWGREALHLHAMSFQVYRAPTEHPAAIAFGALLGLAGNHADRLLVGATIASFMVLSAGLYRLARLAFTPLVGVLAVALLFTRFNLAFLAVRGYVDVPYLALIVWAAALETERPRRGLPVFALLFCADLMRPEAWLLSGIYFLWCAHPASWRERAQFAAVIAAGPLIWAGVDLLETGDPLFSLHSTSGLAATLGRAKGIGSVPAAIGQYLVRLDKLPVIGGAIAGLLLAGWLVPKRARMPAAVLAVGLGTFVLIGAAGLSVIDRYLLVPALMVILFAAVGLGGWTMLAPGGRVRRIWAGAGALLLLYGALAAGSTFSPQTVKTELGFRGDSHTALAAILRNSRVRAGLRCGPLSVPNHKLVPDARWELHRGAGGVLARSEARVRAQQGRFGLLQQTMHGVALYPTGLAVIRQAIVDPSDDPRDQVPLPGFRRVATTQYYGAFVRC